MHRGEVSVPDQELGVTATWRGGGVAYLFDDSTGQVLARAAVAELAEREVVYNILQGMIEQERWRRRTA